MCKMQGSLLQLFKLATFVLKRTAHPGCISKLVEPPKRWVFPSEKSEPSNKGIPNRSRCPAPSGRPIHETMNAPLPGRPRPPPPAPQAPQAPPAPVKLSHARGQSRAPQQATKTILGRAVLSSCQKEGRETLVKPYVKSGGAGSGQIDSPLFCLFPFLSRVEDAVFFPGSVFLYPQRTP